MIKNFLLVAYRNVLRHKGFSFINITGLTLGLTASILIGLFVQDEYSYDRFLTGGNHVYRIYDHYTNGQEASDYAVTPPAITTTLKQQYPEVVAVTRVMEQADNKKLFEAGARKFYAPGMATVDSTFFTVFPLTFDYGLGTNALMSPTSIVLSKEFAYRLFGAANVVGKQLLMDKKPFTVTGVFEKEPKFHLQFDCIVPLASAQLPADVMRSWVWQQFYSYVKVRNDADVNALQAKFQKLVTKETAPFMNEIHGNVKPIFQPLADIHLHSASFKFDVAGRGNIGYVNALMVIATFILLIACFNFVNLATARSLQRAKEVGVRKSVGAGRRQLVFQFLGETMLFSCAGVILSIILVSLLLPWLNQFTGKHISPDVFVNPVVLTAVIVLGIFTGIIAGMYPALILSAFKPAMVLKGNIGSHLKGSTGWVRQALVVTQFALSALLTICALIIVQQVAYLHKKDLGFNKDEIMFFPVRGDNISKNVDAFKNELLQVPGVNSVSIGYGFPGDAVAGDQVLALQNGEWKKQPATQLLVDYDYIKTLGLNVIAGRGFDKAIVTDKDNAFIINETAVKELGFGTPEKAINKKLAWNPWNATNPDSLKKGVVIGVVKDFNYKSLYDKVETAVLQIYPDAAWKVAVKINPANMATTISGVTKTWNAFSSEYPLEYKFLDENFEQMYNAEDKLQWLVWIFTGVAVFVGCLGLFGLSAYTVARRRKELGIRKVLGASQQGLVVLIAKSFLQLVALSLLIASPIAWLCANNWLQNFAYRITIGWQVFAVTGIIIIAIAFATVCFQAIKASIVNPVAALKNE